MNKLVGKFLGYKHNALNNNGTSLKVAEKSPPDVLYHGSAAKFCGSVESMGLIAMGRQQVHLSSNVATAIESAKRHGAVVVYVVDCNSMVRDGYKFYLSKDNVWMTETVPIQYLRLNIGL